MWDLNFPLSKCDVSKGAQAFDQFAVNNSRILWLQFFERVLPVPGPFGKEQLSEKKR